jgi:hypothetical protein
VNNKKYWLRGGLILAALAFIVIFSATAYEYKECAPIHYRSMCGFLTAMVNIPMAYLSFPIINKISDNVIIQFTFLGASSTVFWFIIGSVLGWVSGKFIRHNNEF